MGMEEPHAHMGESLESLSASPSFFVGFVSPSASSLIQSFHVVLDPRHLGRIVLLTRYALIIPSLSHKMAADRPSKVGG
jgi:hypothetical protein